jgi:flagellar L-ring protein precursor FlgH
MILFLSALALAQDPVPQDPQEPQAPVEENALLAQPVISTEETTGSLWNTNRARMLVGIDGNARAEQDLVTVIISEQMASQVSAATRASRASSVNAGIGSLLGIRNKIVAANPNMGGEIALGASSGSDFDGDANTSRDSTLKGTLTCEVIAVKNNGNLVVFGWKEVRSNRETQYLSLSGEVRPQDIRANNTVDSNLLANARIEYTGSGVVSDKQGPGLGTRLVDNVWPF